MHAILHACSSAHAAAQNPCGLVHERTLCELTVMWWRTQLMQRECSSDVRLRSMAVSFAQISFGKILTPLGVGMLTYGFGSFFNLLPGGDLSSLLLIYGFVISLLGFALAYAQLVPVPCKTTKDAFDLRDAQATDIQKQVGHWVLGLLQCAGSYLPSPF